MAGLLVVADVHVGNHGSDAAFDKDLGAAKGGINARCRLVLDVLTMASSDAVQEDRTLVIVGDLFDVSRPPAPVIRAAMDALGAARVIVIAGNHDRASTEPGNNALQPLVKMKNVTVVDTPRLVTTSDGIKVFCVPPAPNGKSMRDWLIENRPKDDFFDVLALHAGIRDDDSRAPWEKESLGAVSASEVAEFAKSFGASHVYAGDWHTPMRWVMEFDKKDRKKDVVVQQCGALVPTGFDNPGENYGKAHCWDVGRNTPSRTYHGPRFVIATSMAEAEALRKKPMTFVKVELPEAEVRAAREGATEGILVRAKAVKRDVPVRQAVMTSTEAAIKQASENLGRPPKRTAAVIERARRYYASAQGSKS